jgi:hypothetical protein
MSLMSSSLQTLRAHGNGETDHHDPARCKEFGIHGRHYVLVHFDRQVLARKLTDVMRHVVSKG